MADILVPLDGSALAERVLPSAAGLARAANCTLRLVEAITSPFADNFASSVDEIHSVASEYLNAVAERTLRAYDAPSTTVSQFGPAVGVILAEAKRQGVRYIAMSTHARAGLQRAVVGSVAEHVLRESPVPVYLLPAAAGAEFEAIQRVLIPLDGSHLSEAVLEPAAALASQLGATLVLVRVYEPPEAPLTDDHGVSHRGADHEVERIEAEADGYLAALLRRVRLMGAAAEPCVEIGARPADSILSAARKTGAGLIAMATHGRSGLDRLRHGSVTEEVLRHSTLPLLVFGRVTLHELVPAEAPGTLARVAGAMVVGT